MALNSAQLLVLKNDIAADPTLSALPMTNAAADQIAAAYNAVSAPDYWVWKNYITEHEIVEQTSVDGTVWSWPAYIARSLQEQNAWVRMFNGSFSINPSIPQVRTGIADIFSGNTNSAPAQRAHLLAIGRRKASRVEKLFSVGAGTTAAPSNMGFSGQINQNDVTTAREMT